MGMYSIRGFSRNYWEVEKKIAERLGTSFWVKCPPVEDEIKRVRSIKKGEESCDHLTMARIQKSLIFLSWSKNVIIANRFDPALVNKKYRIALDFRSPSRAEKKILDLFYWTWIVVPGVLSEAGLRELENTIRKELDEKANIFKE